MKIQCKLGPAQPVVGGHTYDFRPDEHGRYVADVQDIVHRMVMLSVEHYIEAPEIVVVTATEPEPPVTAAPAPVPAQGPSVIVPAVDEPEPTPATSASSAQAHRGRRGKRRG